MIKLSCCVYSVDVQFGMSLGWWGRCGIQERAPPAAQDESYQDGILCICTWSKLMRSYSYVMQAFALAFACAFIFLCTKRVIMIMNLNKSERGASKSGLIYETGWQLHEFTTLSKTLINVCCLPKTKVSLWKIFAFFFQKTDMSSMSRRFIFYIIDWIWINTDIHLTFDLCT